MDMRLIIWGVFGGVGFLFFVFLVEFLRRFNRETVAVGGTSGVVHGTAAVPVTILRDFSYQQLQIATNGFSKESLLKQGVFSGNIEGESVVIKCVESTLVFQNELEIVSAVGSAIPRRFVEILGICREEKIPGILVFKQMPNGDLASALKRGDESMKSSDGECESSDSSSSGSSKPLDWVTRFKIAIGVAEALVFLHHECSPAIIHRDVKSSSILLDEAYEVRLGSFGKACRQQGGGNAYPIYDIYSYGRVALDLISGLDISSGADTVGEAWLQKAVPLMEFKKQEAFVSLVDPHLVLEEDHVKELMLLAVIARSCIDAEQVQHQSMANILQMLQNPAFFLAVVAGEC